jgi:predicted nuclease with TOPRIM domain
MEPTPREAELLERLEVSESENQAVKSENKRLQIKVAELQERIDQLCRKVFGASNEKLDANQLMLLEAEAKKDEAPAVPIDRDDGSRK